ncbi:cbb3-type cytochrome oxidase assembly protein CcoS [Photobacterium sp. S4TG1]|uniref:cbb3-type cytochrome oxidase assembly protein CcoS n=1 Tax=Photobacterium sp. S4TG1 TaxID=3114587 RepID=UPI002E197492|nr:cbb3-type cytochrome oxidase assembly protein CcoS [Photobacterium sp. S4TG1]
MAILYILIPIVLIFICLTIMVFLWAVHNNQFEDLEHQGHNILFDDDVEKPSHPSQMSSKNSPHLSDSDDDRT